MRFYDIQILDSPGGAVSKRPDGSDYRWTSFVNGVTLLGAQQVEFDVPTTGYATPIGGASVRIWGVALQDIAQSANLNGKSIQLYGGMKPGLPLATSQSPHAGLLLTGSIQQAFGNWINTDQYLELVVFPPIGDPTSPLNLSFTWTKGQALADAIRSTLTSALPGYTANINIDPNVVLAQTEPGYFESVSQFAAYLKDMSRAVIQGDYQGIDVLLEGTTFTVYDGSTQAAPVVIDFSDMIGQPTWIGPGQVQANVVMRADIGVGSFIQFPQAQFTTTAPSLSQFRDRSTFQGRFQVGLTRHVGNFRQPSAESWITTLNCFPAATS